MEQELPKPAAGGKCTTCGVPLFFSPAGPGKPACFICKRCKKLYRGPQEWTGGPT